MTIMPRYPAEHKQATRERILAAADAVMKSRGVESASVESVMREAGLTVGGFYAHFASKEDLAREAMLDGLARSFVRMRPPPAGAGPVASRAWLLALIDGYLAQADDPDLAHACPLTLLLPEVARADDAFKARFAKATGAMLDRLVEHFPARDGLSPRETALATYGALAGAVALARASASPRARAAILGACRTMLVGWLGLEAPGRRAPIRAVRPPR